MMEYDYYYTPDRIWLTGMPRFDLLYHDERKYITIMPTWRKSLMAGSDPVTSIWLKGPNFEQSEYVKFYNELLNNEEFIGFCKSKGYTLCFMPHPNIAPYVADCFKKHQDVIFINEDKTYRDIFAETDIMVTDYSSVAFDFAYLRKPIVYCHFDRDEFFNGSHSYTEGYFDYERDGFGPVCLDVKSTIDTIKKTVDSGCKMENKYLNRVNETFAFSDKNSSERVLEKLL
jgi:CDP-glycerol glycerophosphotransferase (TagB/SpsB family)